MNNQDNFYAPPTEAAAPITTVAHDVYQDGKFLILRTGTVLPPVCVHTNEPVVPGASGKRKQFKLSWTPSWVFLLILVNLIVLLIVAVCVGKKCQLTYSLSSQIIKRNRLWGLVGLGTLLLSIAAGIYSAMEFPIFLWLWIPLGFIGIFMSLLGPTRLIPRKHKDGWFYIDKCSPEFLQRFPSLNHSLPPAMPPQPVR